MSNMQQLMPMTTVSSAVRTSNCLDLEGLHSLIDGEILALVVPRFYEEEAASILSRRLLISEDFGHYANAADIGRVGMALFETVDAAESVLEEYLDRAEPAMESLRLLSLQKESPFDRFLERLNESWPSRAQRLRFGDRFGFAGLARVFEPGAAALPHQDVLAWDVPFLDVSRRCQAQIAMNVYLAMPEAGGEVELWWNCLTREEYETARVPGSYGLDRRSLPEPVACLTPQTGDLILFDSTRVHAVRASIGSPRVTVSCFVGFTAEDEPLVVWS